jgi:hypothetical protein
MSRVKSFLAALLPLMLLAVPLAGHEGHDHKVMGTVAAVQERQIDVKLADGKTSTVTLDEKTKILRGTSPLRVTDIRPGDRIVVTATQTKDKAGKVIMLAKEALIGVAAAPAAQ